MRLALGLLVFISASALHLRADLVIDPIYDSSITSNPAATAIENTIVNAIGVFETTYATPITVPIYFQADSSGLSSSLFFLYSASYSLYYSDLLAVDSNPAAIAGLQANGGSGPENPVTDDNNISIKSANARAVGIAIAPGCIPTGTAGAMTCAYGQTSNSVDAIVSLNMSLLSPPLSASGSNYSLSTVVEHELDEVLGLGSTLPNTSAASGNVSATDPEPEDLFRYGSNGQRVFGVNCASPGSAFFSYGGATNLDQFNNTCAGDDFGDWAGTSAEVQNAIQDPGPGPMYGPNEIAALTAIGYTQTAPEPSTGALLTLAAVFVFVRLTRRSARPVPEAGCVTVKNPARNREKSFSLI